MDCKRAKIEFYRVLDGEINRISHNQLNAHLESCESCREEKSSIEVFNQKLLRDIKISDLSAEFNEKFMSALGHLIKKRAVFALCRPLVPELNAAGLLTAVILAFIMGFAMMPLLHEKSQSMFAEQKNSDAPKSLGALKGYQASSFPEWVLSAERLQINKI